MRERVRLRKKRGSAEFSQDKRRSPLTKGHERKESHSVTAPVRPPQIGDNASGVRKRSGGEASAEEAEDDERPDIRRERASDLEACG